MENSTQYGTVKQFVNKEIWQLAKMSVFQHDSFSCKKYSGSVSFPTERQGLEFVGSLYRNGTVRQNDIDVLKHARSSAKC